MQFLASSESSTASTDRTENQAELYAFCEPSCLDLINSVFISCDDEADNAIRLYKLICTFDNGVSCADASVSYRITDLTNSIEKSGVCDDDSFAGQMCSSECQAAYQKLVYDGGCCAVAMIEFPGQNYVDQLQAQCPIDLSCSRGGTSGLKTFASVMLFAASFALAAL